MGLSFCPLTILMHIIEAEICIQSQPETVRITYLPVLGLFENVSMHQLIN
jgi:hypothetical protein